MIQSSIDYYRERNEIKRERFNGEALVQIVDIFKTDTLLHGKIIAVDLHDLITAEVYKFLIINKRVYDYNWTEMTYESIMLPIQLRLMDALQGLIN